MSREQITELAELAGGFIHEIKNHLGTLALNLQLLAEDFEQPESPRERRALERVQRLQNECQQLVEVSNDFLRFARVKDLDLIPCVLAGVIDELCDFFGPMAKLHNIDIKSYLPANLPQVKLDRDLFKQALLNLLLNAQQAMPQGGELTIQAQAQGGEVVLALIDTGKGMTPEVLARAFKPFYSTRQGGTGLGLPTTKRIVEAHGGSLTAESEPGKGTRFTLRLPAVGVSGPMMPLAMLDGVRMPLSEANVPVLDRGFLFGDGIYEVLRVYGGKPFREDDHFERLERSLAEIRLHGVDLERLRRQMHETIAAGTYCEALVYLQVTRGAARTRSHAFPVGVKPTELLWVAEIGDPYQDKRATGVTVSLQPDLRWKRCDIKSTNLLGNVLAIQAAREAGASEALLYTPDGTLTEGSHSGFFGVKDGKLITTPLTPAILPSVTRKVVLEIARRLGIDVEERSLQRDELKQVDELFLAGTTAEVLGIIRVDDLVIGDGLPGPITRRLAANYR